MPQHLARNPWEPIPSTSGVESGVDVDVLLDASILDGPVRDVLKEIAQITDPDQLARLRAVEEAGKARKTVLAVLPESD